MRVPRPPATGIRTAGQAKREGKGPSASGRHRGPQGRRARPVIWSDGEQGKDRRHPTAKRSDAANYGVAWRTPSPGPPVFRPASRPAGPRSAHSPASGPPSLPESSKSRVTRTYSSIRIQH